MKLYRLLLAGLILTTACNKDKHEYDASGTFESTEVIVSAQAEGQILQLGINEGDSLQAGQVVGYIDSTQLYWRKQQLQASGKAIAVTKPDVNEQVAAIQQQIENADRERMRTENMVKADAAPQKQLDDINEQIKVLRKQLAAQQSTVSKSANGVLEQAKPIDAQVKQTEDQLKNCKIINPVAGTVLTKYAEQGEMASPGKPLYRIADMHNMILRAYVTNDQLSEIKLGQEIKVYVDNGAKAYKELNGKVTWISGEAEFTPKTIQTKDERANLVYAIKISVPNNGYLKIGMYGEVKFK